MNITQDEFDFITVMDARCPDKRILQNFHDFLAIDPVDRPQLAQDKIDVLPRSGYVACGVPREEAETVGQHVRDMKRVAREIKEYAFFYDLDMIIDTHDMPEAIVGDFMPSDGITAAEKQRLEEIAINVIFQAFPDRIDAWHQFETGSTVNGRIAKDIDRLQMLDQARKYQARYPELNLSDIIKTVTSRKPESFASDQVMALFRKRMAAPVL